MLQMGGLEGTKSQLRRRISIKEAGSVFRHIEPERRPQKAAKWKDEKAAGGVEGCALITLRRREENYSCGEQGPEGRELGGRTKRQLAGAEESSAEKTRDKCPRQGRKSPAPRSASRGPRGQGGRAQRRGPRRREGLENDNAER